MPGGRGAFASARPQASPRARRRYRADNATAERREAASRLRGRVHASQAWRRALLRDTYKAVTSLGAPPIPSPGGSDEGEKRKEKNPDAQRAGDEETGLFDIVNRKRRGRRIGQRLERHRVG